jgi:hypothetical protein
MIAVPPPSRDLWAPPRGRTYSKEAVNKAGELLREFFHTPQPEGQDALEGWDEDA